MLDQDQYWLGHLKAIDASGTTTKAYGKLHGLNGRGRDNGYPMPPAQIRTCSITAYGSCLRS